MALARARDGVRRQAPLIAPAPTPSQPAMNMIAAVRSATRRFPAAKKVYPVAPCRVLLKNMRVAETSRLMLPRG